MTPFKNTGLWSFFGVLKPGIDREYFQLGENYDMQMLCVAHLVSLGEDQLQQIAPAGITLQNLDNPAFVQQLTLHPLELKQLRKELDLEKEGADRGKKMAVVTDKKKPKKRCRGSSSKDVEAEDDDGEDDSYDEEGEKKKKSARRKTSQAS
ncbi:hypothetical protein B484DRAFT_408280 [Ochromonadaceae sp. CCMP2298]|nr:hypothetical protein B484DRAFT_408280 [Ochromonadaceae sp. CCMP2298]